jgi:hypothetical protein
VSIGLCADAARCRLCDLTNEARRVASIIRQYRVERRSLVCACPRDQLSGSVLVRFARAVLCVRVQVTERLSHPPRARVAPTSAPVGLSAMPHRPSRRAEPEPESQSVARPRPARARASTLLVRLDGSFSRSRAPTQNLSLTSAFTLAPSAITLSGLAVLFGHQDQPLRSMAHLSSLRTGFCTLKT